MKWKLTIRKEIKVGVALVAVSFLIAFSERKQGGVVCKDIVIELVNDHENHFLDEADVMRLVETNNPSLRGTTMDRIDLKIIESKLKQDRHILDAQLFCDLKGNLMVQVELRRPVARIIQEDAPDAYIAEDGTVMPVSEKFASRVLLISGEFVRKLLDNEDVNKTPEGQQLMEMIRSINENSFWRAQVAQLDMNSEAKITIYPQVTGQRIEFGRLEDIENKFKKLMIFYKEILPQRGWTKYRRVNLEYEGQVIAE
jgi:cell division protein FtsQ